MRAIAILNVSWLWFPAFVLAAGTEPPAPAASNPLKITIPDAQLFDQTDLPKGAILRIGSASTPRELEGGFCYSPDGKFIAFGTTNRMVQVWELETGKVVQRFGPFQPSGMSSQVIAGAFFSPDGKTLAVAAGLFAYLYDLNTGKECGKLEGHSHVINTVAFAEDGKRIVTDSFDNTLAVWDRRTLKKLHSFGGFENPVLRAALSPDNSLLAGADSKGTVKLWKLPSNEALPNLPGLKSLPVLFRFVDDGKSLLAVGADEGLFCWSVPDGKERQRIPEIKGGVAVSPDGSLLLSYPYIRSTGSIQRWDRKSGKSIGKIPGDRSGVECLNIAPDLQSFATYGPDPFLRRWKVSSGEEIDPPQGHQHHVYGVAFTRDAKRIISCSDDGTLRFWDASTGRECKRISAKDEYFHALAVSSDGKTLAWAGNNSLKTGPYAFYDDRQTTNLRFWDLETDQEIRSFYRTGFAVGELRFTEGNRELFALGRSNVRFVDVKTGKERSPIPGAEQGMPAADVSPDGRYLASSSNIPALRQIGKLAYFDLIDSKEVFSKTFYLGGYDALAFAPDGQYLAVSGSGGVHNKEATSSPLQLWAVPTDQAIRDFETTKPSSHLTFSRDGRLLAAVQAERIAVFEVATGKLRRSFTGHESGVQCIAFSRDGRRIVSGGDDCRIFVWDNTGLHGKGPSPKLDPKALDLLWSELADADAGKAADALWTLAARPEESLPYLQTRLVRLNEEALGHIEKLVAQLDADQFRMRDRAVKELEKIGEAAAPVLTRALTHKSQEVREAADRLLKKIGTGEDPVKSPNARRMLRAIEALEQIGNTEARSLLKELQRRGQTLIQHREATAALKRME